MTRFNQTESRVIPPPPLEQRHPSSAPISSLSGRYANAGYGDLDLRLLLGDPSESGGDSKRCRELKGLEEPSFVADGHGEGILLGKWDKLLCSHLCFDHFDGDLFNLTLLNVWV